MAKKKSKTMNWISLMVLGMMAITLFGVIFMPQFQNTGLGSVLNIPFSQFKDLNWFTRITLVSSLIIFVIGSIIAYSFLIQNFNSTTSVILGVIIGMLIATLTYNIFWLGIAILVVLALARWLINKINPFKNFGA